MKKATKTTPPAEPDYCAKVGPAGLPRGLPPSPSRIMKTASLITKHPTPGQGKAAAQTHAAVQQMTDLLAGLPPLPATASWTGADAKYARIAFPKEYLKELAVFMKSAWTLQLDPGRCIRAVPSLFGVELLEAVSADLAERGQVALISDAEANSQTRTPDRRGRMRVSWALLEAAGVTKAVVFCAHGWWVEVWGREVRAARLQFPGFPKFAPGAPALAHDVTA